MRPVAFSSCVLALFLFSLGCQRDTTPPIPKMQPGEANDKYTGKPPQKSPVKDVAKKDAHPEKDKDRLAKGDDVKQKKDQAPGDEKKKKETDGKPGNDPLAKALPLQAPPLGLGTSMSPIWPPMDDFAERMRGIANNEQAIKFGQSPLYRSTFSTRNFRQDPPLKWASGRNALVFAGRYDPVKQINSWDCYLWFQNKGNRFANGKFFAEARDVCLITVALPMDSEAARAWHNAFQAGNLELTIWYRFDQVVRKRWAVLPDELIPGRRFHDVAFDAKIEGFESNVGKVK